MNKNWLAWLAAILPATSFATAFDVFAHVTEIEPSYVPDHVIFAIDQSAGECPAGPWLFFYGTAGSNNLPENIKAMYAGLTTAMVSDNVIEVTGNDSGCLVTDIHFLNHP